MEPTEQLAAAPQARTDVVTISMNARVTMAAQIMHQNRVGCLVVVDDDGDLVGVVSERDILTWVSAASPSSYSAQVADIMTTNVITCTAETSPEEAREIMVRHRIRHLPMVEGGKPVGMLSIRDLMCRHVEA